MATNAQSSPSISSSPETYQGGASGYHPKNTYRQIPGQIQNQNNLQHYAPGFPGGQYTTQMAVPFYPQIPASNAGFLPVYGNAAPPDQPYYYYGPNSWAMHGPMHVYAPHAPVPPLPHGFGSPPGTPPQPQLAYGYPMLAPGQTFQTSSPGQIAHDNGSGQSMPSLDHRRNSWSSSGATDAPTTPFATNIDLSPTIIGEAQHNHLNDGMDKLGKSVESLLLAGPPLPRPIPGSFSPGAPKTLSQTLENPTNTTNVYIRGLPPCTDDDKLFEMTGRFGNVISHKAIMDTEHGTCKGYGFARYETIQEAEKCIRGLVSLKYEAGFARESFNARLKILSDPNSTNIYVSNLPRDMNEKAMQDIFAGYVVVSNRILRDSNGNSRGVGFARFESREICDNIIRKFHGTPVGDEKLPLQVRYADTSAQKRLKATTTKKRQFRANEYNSVVNNNYHMAFNGGHQPQMYNRNRAWLRQNSTSSNTDMHHVINSKSSARNWEKSQDWAAGNNDENKHSDWKPVSGSWRGAGHNAPGPESHLKLETVHEKDDHSTDIGSDGTAVPNIINYGILSTSVGKSSSGSFSDPGDSYGGREFESNISIS